MARKSAIAPDVALAEIFASVAEQSALSRAQMAKYRGVLGAIREPLQQRGFDVGAVVRVPLAKQVLALLESAPQGIPVPALLKQVAGGSAVECKRALTAMLQQGDVVEAEAAHGRVIVLARCVGPGWLGGADLAAYAKALQQELRRIKTTAKSKVGATAPKPMLVRELGVASAAVALAVAAHGSAEPASRAAPAQPSQVIGGSAGLDQDAATLAALAAQVRGKPGPLHVPALLRSLGVSVEVAQRALLAGARAGLFDLEPESGMARLSSDDAAWCPPGPGQTRLSWLMPKAAR
ncbi:MAG TPA: hypothetical protein PLF40_10845 [Kofleriaceae bacterium]|nr:hypothetical protein [Kofleriaceae bacterium]